MKFLIVGFMLILSGCHKKSDEVKEASQDNPNVQPPIGPICSQAHFTTSGEFHPPVNQRLDSKTFLIPNFDLSKDTLAIQYKCFLCSAWTPAGNSEAIGYTVAGSNVTIIYLHVGDWQWNLDALVNVCN